MSSSRSIRAFQSASQTTFIPKKSLPPARLYRCLSYRQQPLIHQHPLARQIHTSRPLSAASKSRDRGPRSTEDTQTDFADLNVLRSVPVPSTAVDACTNNGFHLNSGVKITDSGVLLVAGQAFDWKPWIREGRKEGTIADGGRGNDSGAGGRTGKVFNAKGQFEIQESAWGVLELVWPKPDLLIIGTGPTVRPLSPATRQHINDLGIRVEVQDTRNAASQFNLLATERGLQQVAAAMVPVGWKDGR